MRFVFASTLLLAGLAAGNISVISPCPRYSSVGTDCPSLPSGQSLDKDMGAPISSLATGTYQPLCKHTVAWPKPAATWTAGESVTVKFDSSSDILSGGDMEFSISYDGGKTFAVIYQVLRYAFLNGKPSGETSKAQVLEYTFTLPKDLPNSDSAIFAWTWLPASGDREFFMNCADVSITGSTSKSYTAKAATIVNYPGYPTVYPMVNSTSNNYDIGMEYYTTNVKKVTVSPSGSSVSDEAAAGVSGLLGFEALLALLLTASEANGKCTSGALECSGTGFRMCSNSVWTNVQPCGAGTKCKGTGSNIYCG